MLREQGSCFRWFVFGLLLGFAIGTSIALPINKVWRQWAIKMDCAHYDAKTGQIIYHKAGEQP